MNVMAHTFDRDEIFLMAEEVAARYRCSLSSLANHRVARTGLPWVKINGRVLYRVSDHLTIEQAGSRGLSWETVSRALTEPLDKREAPRVDAANRSAVTGGTQ